MPFPLNLSINIWQHQIATAVPKKGFGLFFSGKQVKHRRRQFQQRRKQLQKAGKYRAVKKLEQKEQRWMRAVNHTVSRRIVNFADWQNADLVLEDLSGCLQTMKQRKKQRADNAESRHAWAYYDLGQKLEYKMAKLGRLTHYRPPHYSSKTSSINGVIGNPLRVGVEHGDAGSPFPPTLNSMNIINGRAKQLCLFDSTDYETRRENPTALATA